MTENFKEVPVIDCTVESILRLTPEMISGSPYSTSRQIKKELRREISDNSVFKINNSEERTKSIQQHFGNILKKHLNVVEKARENSLNKVNESKISLDASEMGSLNPEQRNLVKVLEHMEHQNDPNSERMVQLSLKRQNIKEMVKKANQ